VPSRPSRGLFWWISVTWGKAMAGLAVIIILALVLGSFFLLAKNPTIEPTMRKHPMIAVWVMLGATFFITFVLRLVIIEPCFATTRTHTVTDNLGRFYTTDYKDSGEWCLWVRAQF
jgi:hypothetical protein